MKNTKKKNVTAHQKLDCPDKKRKNSKIPVVNVLSNTGLRKQNHNTPNLRCWRFGTHAMPPPVGPCVTIWGPRAVYTPHFWGHQAPRAMVALWLHASCPKTAKKRQNPKNSQPQALGPSGKKVLAPATNCKNWPGTLVGMP